MASLLLLVGINCYFLLYWGYLVCLYLNYKNKYFVGFLKFYHAILCKNPKKLQAFKIESSNNSRVVKKLVKYKKKKLNKRRLFRRRNRNYKKHPQGSRQKPSSKTSQKLPLSNMSTPISALKPSNLSPFYPKQESN